MVLQVILTTACEFVTPKHVVSGTLKILQGQIQFTGDLPAADEGSSGAAPHSPAPKAKVASSFITCLVPCPHNAGCAVKLLTRHCWAMLDTLGLSHSTAHCSLLLDIPLSPQTVPKCASSLGLADACLASRLPLQWPKPSFPQHQPRNGLLPCRRVALTRCGH